ncbi:hypothetical protein ABZP36_007916 [Zizania latifolia]
MHFDDVGKFHEHNVGSGEVEKESEVLKVALTQVVELTLVVVQFKNLENRVVATQEDFDMAQVGAEGIMKIIDGEAVDLIGPKEGFLQHIGRASERLKTYVAATHVLAMVQALYPRTELKAIGEEYLVTVNSEDVAELINMVQDTSALLTDDLDLFDDVAQE